MLLSKQLLLIRHATTDLAGKLCGHLDPPLNLAGQAQARALAHALGTEPIDCVYASDLLRAIQTAEPFATAKRIPVLSRRDLREISFGAWEGMRWTDLQVQNALTSGAMESSPEACPPGGETFVSFGHRVMHALDEVVLDSPHQTTAIVTHLGVIRIALAMYARIDPSSNILRQIDYCSAYRFVTNDGAWEFTGRL